MRRVCGRLGGTIGVGLVLEGIGLGRVYHAGLGVRRLRVSVSGPGGHSWLHAERPSAAHHLLRIGAALVERIRPPEQPRATFNIGVIEGGTSINTRAAEASLWIDLRAVDAATLGRLEAQAQAVIGEFEDEAELSVTTEVVGDRPSGALPVGHPLVRAAQAALQVAGYSASPPEVGSTDANALLAAAIPAVCIGITTGGNAHTLDEYIDTGPLATGMRQLTLLALLAAEHAEEWQRWRASDGR
jgi:acetylornithine deacetylase/succinyl-diaminopimelate desuccinylase-like protein